MSRSLHLKHTGRSPTRPGFIGSSSLLGQVLLDHPRSRGVYALPCEPAPAGLGSSPLARGLPVQVETVAGRVRIIPARAGFTTSLPPRRTVNRDHPRSRGVYRNCGAPFVPKIGSSPLARGLLQAVDKVAYLRRIIPARAGFTAHRSRGCCWRSDHPRSRGVYGGQVFYDLAEQGSSPLARGLLG